MKKIVLFIHFACLAIITGFYPIDIKAQQKEEYKVAKLNSPIVIDADWNKTAWQGVDSIKLENRMGALPEFIPITYAKMLYDDLNVYVIFKVQDRFVRIVTNEINGPVWEDACAEFFFSPDMTAPEKYFNLEITGGGTPLICYNSYTLELQYLDTTDIKEIEIAHSLPELVPDEIVDSVTWTLEYKIPLALLEKYAQVSRPAPGVSWRANFYKCASNNSNPHYYTWSPVTYPTPNFHLPAFFGTLTFDDVTASKVLQAPAIQLYPNPASESFRVTGLTGPATVKIYNGYGSLVVQHANSAERIDIADLKSGMYFVHVVEGEKSLTRKLIIN